MMTRLKQFVAVAMIAAVAFSCKDDDEVSISATAALTSSSKGWVITGATISPAILGITDWYAQYDDCEKDDATIFTSDGKYKIESSVKCDPSEPTIVETGSWTLSSDNKVLSMTDSDSYVEELTITEASASTLKFTQTEELNSVKYTLTLTLTPKK